MIPRRKRASIALAIAAATAFALSACSGGGAQPTNNDNSGGGTGDNSGYTFAMITHAPQGDSFWDKIQTGAEQAAKNSGSKLNYSGDPDSAKQAQLIQAAVDSKVDGIAVSLASPDALKGSIQAARAAGIPVVAFNAGLDQYKDVGAQMYFGSDEALAGQAAGEKIAADGGKKVLCVIQAAGVISLETRCAGVKKGVSATENIQVNGQDDSAVTSTIQAKLAEDKSIDYVVTLGAPIALDAMKAKDAAGSSAKIVTFDLNTDVAQAIKDGKVEFSVDQQPYVQGFLSVTMLYLNKKNGNDLGGGKPVLTGPSFVDSSNIDTILPFAQKNTR
jgi:simple sugar transport system substrate-binding protein